MNPKTVVNLLAVPLLTLLPAFAAAVGLTKQQVEDYYAAWSAGDTDAVMTYFSSAIVYEDVATGDKASGTAEVRAFAQKFLDSTPGVSIVPTSVVVDADGAAVEWTMSAGTGDEAWSVRGAAVMKHANGKITHATDYWNAE